MRYTMLPDVLIFRWMAVLDGFVQGLSKMLLVKKDEPFKLMLVCKKYYTGDGFSF